MERYCLSCYGGADVVGKIGEGIKGAFNSVVQWGKDIINKLMEGLKAAWESVVTWFNGVWNSLFGNRTANVTVNKKVTGVDGSNAAGLDYVPFDGYISELHKGEMVVPGKYRGRVEKSWGYGKEANRPCRG